MSFGRDLFSGHARAVEARTGKSVTGPQRTTEFERIHALPARLPSWNAYDDLTPLFARDDGALQLRMLQNAMLWEAVGAGGLLAAVGVGEGKTLACLLLPDATRAERPVLLVPHHMRAQLLSHDVPYYSQHFHIRPVGTVDEPPPPGGITVVSYEELSSKDGRGLLDRLDPDWAIADEAHYLRNFTAARTDRFITWARPRRRAGRTRFVFMSGTITGDSIYDYAHLARLALDAGSPLPRNAELREWADCVDVGATGPAGCLAELHPAHGHSPGSIPPENAFRWRLVHTRGIIVATDPAQQLSASLTLRHVKPPVPKVVTDALEELRGTWALAGEEYMQASQVAAQGRCLSVGFYHRQEWPEGQVDHEYLEARREWHRAVRVVLERAPLGQDGLRLDTPGLVQREVLGGGLPELQSVWRAWEALSTTRPGPVARPVWLSDYAIDYAVGWAHTRPPGRRGIIWYWHNAVGDALAARGIPVYGADSGSELIQAAKPAGPPVIACSIASHGTGKNLQAFCENLVLEWQPNGTTAEQLLGRTHRAGQRADEVFCDIWMPTPECEAAFEAAVQDAKYRHETMGVRDRLTFANVLR